MSLSEHEFWDLIGLVNRTALGDGDEDSAASPVVAALSKRPVEDIFEFEERLAQALYDLDGRRFAAESESGESDDGFLYARCFVVGWGRNAYDEVLADPSRMPKTLDEWFETLLGVSREAFEWKTGQEWDYSASVSYETGSNEKLWPVCRAFA